MFWILLFERAGWCISLWTDFHTLCSDFLALLEVPLAVSYVVFSLRLGLPCSLLYLLDFIKLLFVHIIMWVFFVFIFLPYVFLMVSCVVGTTRFQGALLGGWVRGFLGHIFGEKVTTRGTWIVCSSESSGQFVAVSENQTSPSGSHHPLRPQYGRAHLFPWVLCGSACPLPPVYFPDSSSIIIEDQS